MNTPDILMLSEQARTRFVEVFAVRNRSPNTRWAFDSRVEGKMSNTGVHQFVNAMHDAVHGSESDGTPGSGKVLPT